MSDIAFTFDVQLEDQPAPFRVTAGYPEVIRLEQHFGISFTELFGGIDPEDLEAIDPDDPAQALAAMRSLSGLRFEHMAFLAWAALGRAARRRRIELDPNLVATFDQFLDLAESWDQVDDEDTPAPEAPGGSSA